MITACPPRAGVSRRHPIIPPVKLSVLYPTASVGYAPASNHWRACHTVPEWVPALCILWPGIVHHVGYQLDDIVVRPDIGKGVIAVRIVHIDQIEGQDPESLELQKAAQLLVKFAYTRGLSRRK